MKARKFLGSYLAQEDIVEPTVVTIDSAKEAEFDGEDKSKLALYFSEFDKGFICNSTNINALIALFGSDDTDDWLGKQCTVYVDPEIRFAGKKVGGLRVRTASPE